MGQQFIAKCGCGLETEVSVGSSRSEHGKKFYYPHHCSTCNNVTTVNILAKSYVCPECESEEIHSYSAATQTLPYDSKLNSCSESHLLRLGFHKSSLVADETYCYVLEKTFILFSLKNFCPACEKNSLVFTLSAMYD